VLRRAALDEIGGFATETLAEDAHTSLRLHRRGWTSAYLNLPLSAGLAPPRLLTYVRQRTRWARGMLRLLRVENPLFAGGLSLSQRLCYLNASAHFLFALPRLLLLLAPVLLLLAGCVTWPGSWLELLAYGGPHLLLSFLATKRIAGPHRHAFWNGIYETVLAPWLLVPALGALLSGRSGNFQVTPKRNIMAHERFNAGISWPYLLLFGANLLAVFAAVFRLLFLHSHGQESSGLAIRYLTSVPRTAIVLNVFWAVLNLVLLSVAIAVARESRQRRSTIRISMSVPAAVLLSDGTVLAGSTVDLSSGGALFVAQVQLSVVPQEPVIFRLRSHAGATNLPATVVWCSWNEVRLRFEELSLRDEEVLTTLLYSRADAWTGTPGPRESGSLPSLAHLLHAGARGLSGAVRLLISQGRKRQIIPLGIGAALLLACSLGAGLGGSLSRAQGATDATSSTMTQLPPGGRAQRSIDLALVASSGVDAHLTVAHPGVVLPFAIPGGEVAQNAELRLRYAATATSGFAGYLGVFLNGVEVKAVEPVRTSTTELQSARIQLPSDLLVSRNLLSFRWMAASHTPCEPKSCLGVDAVIGGQSGVRIAVTPLESRTAGSARKQQAPAATRRHKLVGAIRVFALSVGHKLLPFVVRLRGLGRGWWLSPLISACAAWLLAIVLGRALDRRARERLEAPSSA
jgi:cellulose synthase (UDP-forming)